MNNIWNKITDDPATLPPLDTPVFVFGGDLRYPAIQARSKMYDENSNPCWEWCAVYNITWDDGLKKWTADDFEWDDDYQPEYWSAFPASPEDGSRCEVG